MILHLDTDSTVIGRDLGFSILHKDTDWTGGAGNQTRYPPITRWPTLVPDLQTRVNTFHWAPLHLVIKSQAVNRGSVWHHSDMTRKSNTYISETARTLDKRTTDRAGSFAPTCYYMTKVTCWYLKQFCLLMRAVRCSEQSNTAQTTIPKVNNKLSAKKRQKTERQTQVSVVWKREKEMMCLQRKRKESLDIINMTSKGNEALNLDNFIFRSLLFMMQFYWFHIYCSATGCHSQSLWSDPAVWTVFSART